MDCNTNCSISSPDTKSSKAYGRIDTKGLEMLISSGVALVILDKRSGQWDDGKRIATAQVLPDVVTAKQAAKFIPTKHSLVVEYCSNIHCPASSNLAKLLLELGYSNILKYE